MSLRKNQHSNREAMTEEAKRIHAFWFCMVAVLATAGKMTRKKAEKEAYKILVERYGEDYLAKVFEIT